MMQAQQEDALDLLSHVVHTQRARLVAVARREGLAEEDAFDCVQDAFCTFLQCALRAELPAKDSQPAYLVGIVRNAARNKRRRHHLSRPHELPGDVASDVALDEQLVRAEEHVRLRRCVERLCDTQRAVVTLRLLEERDGEDVASALGITRGYVDVLLHRARGSLAACMLTH